MHFLAFPHAFCAAAPSGGGQSDTNPQAFSACNLMRLRLPLRRTTRLWRQLWHLLSQAAVGAVLHPLRRKRRRGSRSLDLPGRPQAIAALDTLALLAVTKPKWACCSSPLGCFIVQSIDLDIWFNHCNRTNGEAVNKDSGHIRERRVFDPLRPGAL